MNTLVLLILVVAGLLAVLGRFVWLPLPLRPSSAPRSGIGRDLVLGLAVLRRISLAYGSLIEAYTNPSEHCGAAVDPDRLR